MTSKSKKATPNKRHLARAYAVQALYQWHFTQTSAAVLIKELSEEHPVDAKQVDLDYFKVLVSGTLAHLPEIDEEMGAVLDRQIAALNPIESAILRLAIYELMFCKAVPYAVVINEAIELTKAFGAEDGYKYVNGVLNTLAPKLRVDEVK